MTILRRSPLTLHRSPRRVSSAGFHSTPLNAAKLTIGIRREDPTRIWERRCPLTPEAVHELIQNEDVDVLVQDCERRVWKTEEFIKAGARPHPTLSPAHITLGIKETPLHEVLTDPIPAPRHDSPQAPLVPRTHLMFSHTTKGQLYNMELLSKFLSSSDTQGPPPRLIDYELLTGEDGKRTVGFGWFAGVAGALEALCALAHAHLELGISSPFLYTPRPHTSPSLASICSTLRDVVGARIATEGTPKSLGPIVLGVTGTGKVAQGVFDLLADLPICKVKARDLPALVSNPDTDLHQIYVVHALPEDYFVRRDGQAYERSHYYINPQEYSSEFHAKIAPYLTLFLNGAGWAPTFPRLMTNDQLTIALEKAQQVGKGRFACIGDISCDVEGGLEFLTRPSTLSTPFFTIRPPSLPSHLPSITMMSVDILPTALPLEASEHFSKVLLPYLKTLIKEYRVAYQPTSAESKGSLVKDVEEGKRIAALERATVASGGQLREPHKWLDSPLGIWKEGIAKGAATDSKDTSAQPPTKSASKVAAGMESKKKVLVLGSGMVAGPAIDEICSWQDVQLVVASNLLSEAERLTRDHSYATPVAIDVNNSQKVGELIGESDLVISLLPVPFHPHIAELCIQHHKHLVTASYISPAMKSLHQRAIDADVLLLNEIGLDPGIDHCSTYKMLSVLREQKKVVKSFTSFCGGLPAPEDAEGFPLKYKFSWSPRGVLSAALNGARYKLMDRVWQIPGDDLLQNPFHSLPISEVLKLEGLPNRDSLPYAETYNLGPLEDIRTIFRGTIRYEGFSKLMHMLKKIGLLEPTALINPGSWSDVARRSLEKKLGTSIPNDMKSLLSAFALRIDDHDIPHLFEALHWFGIVPPELIGDGTGGLYKPTSSDLPPLPEGHNTPIDIFAALLSHKLRYLPGERDLVILSHEMVVDPPQSLSKGVDEVHTSSLVVYGNSKASAMARCVGLPVAFATRTVLDGQVRARGVWGPGVDRQVWGRVLDDLERVGLGMREQVVRRSSGSTVEGKLFLNTLGEA